MTERKFLKNLFIISLVLSHCIEYARSEPISVTIATVITVYEVIIWAKELWHWLQSGWNWAKDLLGYGNTKNQVTDYNQQIYRQISIDLVQISGKIDDLMRHHDEKTAQLAKLIVESHERDRIERGLGALFDKLEAVKLEYQLLMRHLPEPSQRLATKELCDYGNTRLSGDELLKKILAIHSELSKNMQFDSDYWPLLRKKLLEDGDTACGKGHSSYEFMHSIYNQIVLTEMQGYVALLFSHYFVYDNNGNNGCEYLANTADESAARIFEEFEERMRNYVEFFLPLMKGLRKDFRNCDASILQREETFIELEGAIQLVGILPPYRPCYDVSYRSYDRSSFCESGNRCYSLPRPCRGYLGVCRRDHAYQNFCMDDAYSSRRYKWIKQNVAWNYYPPSGCSEYFQTDTRNVYNCLCQCYDNDPSSRSTHLINLQSVEADVDKNMVVTGARFVIKQRVWHLQIQQGELNGFWQVSDVNWKPINDISQEIYAARTKTKVHGVLPNVTENIDYYVIGYPFKMRFNDVRVPENHVLTGVKFHWQPRKSIESAIEVAIIARPFNHSSGILDTRCEPQIVKGSASSRKLEFNRKYPLDYDPHRMLIEVPADNGYVEFRESFWDTDSGQTTVPLLDAVPLVSSPSVPLGGIGIFLKQADKSAALVSLKFISLDYEAYMKKSLDRLKDIKPEASDFSYSVDKKTRMKLMLHGRNKR